MKLLNLVAKKPETGPSVEKPKSPLRPFSVFRSPKRSPKEVESPSSIDIARIPMSFSPLMLGSLIPPIAQSTTHQSPLASQNLSPVSYLIPPGALIPPQTKRTTQSSPLTPEKLSTRHQLPLQAKRSTTCSSPLASEKLSPSAKASILPETRDSRIEENDENDENMNFLQRLEKYDRSRPANLMIKTPSYFAPPKEIKINPNAEPPSPMRDPDMSVPRPLERRPLSNLLNSPGRVIPPELGEPLGDIGMKTQLWDAQRLVRVILGNSAGDDPLDSGSILKAIRTFALLKAELTQLRQQQEHFDPPTIMPLMTPSTCATNLFGESTPQNQAASPWRKTPPPSTDVHRKGLIEAAKRIKSLEQDLESAKMMMSEMQEVIAEKESLLSRAKVDNETLQEQIRTNKERLSQQREQANKSNDHKDFRIFKLEKSNQRMHEDIVQAVENLEMLDFETPREPTVSMMEQELDRHKKQCQSIATTLKASIKTSFEQPNRREDGSERLKQLKSDHEAMISTIRMIEDCNFGLL